MAERVSEEDQYYGTCSSSDSWDLDTKKSPYLLPQSLQARVILMTRGKQRNCRNCSQEMVVYVQAQHI